MTSQSFSLDTLDAATMAKINQMLAESLGQSIEHISDDQINAYLEVLLQEAESQASQATFICLHTLVEHQAQRTPHAPALLEINGPPRTVTYAALIEQASQTAAQLAASGIHAKARVGVYLPPSIEGAVALLAVFQLGAIAVGLDPTWPREFFTAQLCALKPQIIISSATWAATVPAGNPAVMVLEHTSVETTHSVVQDPALIAYVAALPFAQAEVAHESVHNRIQWLQETFNLSAADRVLWTAPLNHHQAFAELLWPLAYGSCVVVPAPTVQPNALAELIHDQAVTVAALTPAGWHTLLEQTTIQPAALRWALCYGAPMPTTLALALRTQWHTQPAYLYTPLAAATDVTVQLDTPGERAFVPLGTVHTDVALYILDRFMQPVPTGVAGQLYVASGLLARQVIDHGGAAAAWVRNPFTVENEPMLPTGDIARRLNNTTIELVTDRQTHAWIDGLHVELATLEAQIARLIGAQACAVLVEYQPNGSGVLKLYAAGAAPNDQSALLQRLQAHLPAVLVPQVINWIDGEAPFTAADTLDRGKLRAWHTQRQHVTIAYVAPGTEHERQLAAIWRTVLKIGQIGIHERFFDLGGDSVLALDVITRANRAGLAITPYHMFHHHTIAELAVMLDHSQEGGPVVQAEQGLVTGDVPLTPAGHFFFSHDIPVPSHFNHAYAFDVPKPLDSRVLEQALQTVLAHHDALRLRFTPAAHSWRQTLALPDDQALCTEHTVASATPAERESALVLITNHLHTRLDLTAGPMLLAAYCRSTTSLPDCLILVIHHLVVDGMSLRVLMEDLIAAYAQHQASTAIQLPAKTTSFKYWAERLADYATTPAADTTIKRAYWQDLVTNPPPPLPLDDPNGRNLEASTAHALGMLSQAETEVLLYGAPRRFQASFADVLLTALAHTLADWSGQPRVMMEIATHGRPAIFDDVDLSRTVGWFSTFYPVVIDLTDAADVAASITTVQAHINAVPDHGFSYLLLRHLSPDASLRTLLSHISKPQALLTYLGQFEQSASDDVLLRLAGTGLGTMHHPQGSRMYQLAFNGMVIDGQFHIALTYSTNLHRRETADRLVDSLLSALRALSKHCSSNELFVTLGA